MSDPTFRVDNTDLHLPVDDYQPQKVVDYNAVFAAENAAWTSWTPTLTNAAIGTGGGALLSAKYRQVGKTVFCRLHIKLGSSGASVSGDLTATFPVTTVSYPGTVTAQTLGRVLALDVSLGASPVGDVVWASTSTLKLRFSLAGGTYVTQGTGSEPSSTTPFTWAAGDEIHAQFSYEAA